MFSIKIKRASPNQLRLVFLGIVGKYLYVCIHNVVTFFNVNDLSEEKLP